MSRPHETESTSKKEWDCPVTHLIHVDKMDYMLIWGNRLQWQHPAMPACWRIIWAENSARRDFAFCILSCHDARIRSPAPRARASSATPSRLASRSRSETATHFRHRRAVIAEEAEPVAKPRFEVPAASLLKDVIERKLHDFIPFAGSASIRSATTSPNTEPEPQADLQALAFGPLHNGIAMPSFILRMLTHALESCLPPRRTTHFLRRV